MPLCIHRWSTIKRWSTAGKYHVIQRCRKCETWIKREIDYKDLEESKPSMITKRIFERNKLEEILPVDNDQKLRELERNKLRESDSRQQSVGPTNSPPRTEWK